MNQKAQTTKKRIFVVFYILLFVLQMSSLNFLPSAAQAAKPDNGPKGQTLPTEIEWDRSSLVFSDSCETDCGKITAEICNDGDSAMAGTTGYEVWYSPYGNPKTGSVVYAGEIPALEAHQCTTMEYFTTEAGNYKFKAYQRPGHPYSRFNVIWSSTCDVNGDECVEPVCGNGKVEAGEACDDGNTVDCDSCSNFCQLKPCELKITKSVDKENALPGDTLTYTINYENLGAEICTGTGVKVYDPLDANLTYLAGSKTIVISDDAESDGYSPTEGSDYDGHSFNLLFNVNRVSPGESGVITLEATINQFGECGRFEIPDKAKIWSNQTDDIWSNEVVTEVNIPCTYCGDGIKQTPNQTGTGGPLDDGFEACDGTDGAGLHQACSDNCSLIEIPYCGDGETDGSEACDDGNTDNNDGCLIDCTLPACGDGHIWQGYEICDDNGLNGIPCLPSYNGQCSFCSGICETETLYGPYCGDNIKNGPEECDGTDGVGPHQSCSQSCTLIDLPYCGNGIVDQGEECDDGNQIDDDECKNDCTRPSICENPLDIMFIMDRSGSMAYDSPTRLSQAKIAANNFIGSLRLGDQSGLVSYSTTATLDKTLSNNQALTQTKINALVATGATNIGDGIKLSNAELISVRANPEASQVAILLTDGLANKPYGPGFGEWPADVAYAKAKADEAAAQGIKIFTIGLGSSVNVAMLQYIASTTSGQYYFAPTAGELQAIFDQIALETCIEPNCGNGIKEVGEQCDGTAGVGPHQSCSLECTLIDLTYCGDGIKQSPNQAGGGPNNDGFEACDGTDGVGQYQSCSSDCTLINLPYCGNGLVDSGEQCDDGNQIDDDDCRNNCTFTQCQPDLDVMMVLDRSGSMGYTSVCYWWQLKCVNPPSCSLGYAWVKNTTYNQTQAWCQAKNQPAPHQSVWIDLGPNKMAAAKTAANGFLDLLSPTDQSGLVSYGTTAILDKPLSNDHNLTQAKINALATNGATNIGDAIKLGAQELTSVRANPQAVKAIILLTDGMANKPYGPGYGEWPADVAYAQDQAVIAANAGIKIFTIGLGNDVDAIMLQNIASTTGGQYYFAPTATDLQQIFDLIAIETCQRVAYGREIKLSTGQFLVKSEPYVRLESLLINC